MDMAPKSFCCLISHRHKTQMTHHLISPVDMPRGPPGCLLPPENTVCRLTLCLTSPKTRYTVTLPCFSRGPDTLVSPPPSPPERPIVLGPQMGHCSLSISSAACLLPSPALLPVLAFPFPSQCRQAPSPAVQRHVPGLRQTSRGPISSTVRPTLPAVPMRSRCRSHWVPEGQLLPLCFCHPLFSCPNGAH